MPPAWLGCPSTECMKPARVANRVGRPAAMCGFWSTVLFGIPLVLLALSSCASKETRKDSHTAVASWYGDEMKGRTTASGEPFNKNALTAAHREFPFGTKLRVTNLSNSRSVVVLVNDRGPFVAGREIDLSYAAAMEIDLIGHGTATVRLDYLGREASYVHEVKYASGRGPYTIQVGSFRDPVNAQHLRRSLEIKYRDVRVTEVEIGGKTYYRVRLGMFDKRGEAAEAAKELADEGYETLVLQHGDQG